MKTEPIVIWSNHARQLKGSQQAKIQKYLDLNLVHWDSERKAWIVDPIPGNTKTAHEVENHAQFKWQCDCQGYNMMLKRHESDPIKNPSPSCSHTGAVWEKIKRGWQEKRQMKLTEAMTVMYP